MGLYIKGMRMPKDNVCAFKQITITNNWVDGEVVTLAHDTITNEFIGEVVEVPEPHGRLVEFIEVATIDDEDSGTELINLGDVFTAYEKMLKAKPVIEAEEE